jgi:hypothetical protein
MATHEERFWWNFYPWFYRKRLEQSRKLENNPEGRKNPVPSMEVAQIQNCRSALRRRGCGCLSCKHSNCCREHRSSVTHSSTAPSA